MLKKFAGLALISLAAATAVAPVWAHGPAQAKHGGVVQKANDLSFEMVSSPTGVVIHIDDHGKPLVPTGMTGQLTILSGTQRTQVPLTVSGNTLQAAGVQLASGSRVVATITTAQRQVMTVRFVAP